MKNNTIIMENNDLMNKIDKILRNSKIHNTKIYSDLKKIEILSNLKKGINKLISPERVLHGDRIFKEIFKLIIKEFKIKTIVETGTYFGWTTKFLAKNFPEISIHSCEIDKYYYSNARNNLKRFKNVHIHYGTSPNILKHLTNKKILPEKTLFFLDAHWKDQWPIEEEVKIISNELKSAIFIIDDFKVDDERFAFDKYKDKECSLERVITNINKKNTYSLLFPRYGEEETFVKNTPHDSLRGYSIIFQNLEAEFKNLLKNPFIKRYFVNKSLLLQDI